MNLQARSYRDSLALAAMRQPLMGHPSSYPRVL